MNIIATKNIPNVDQSSIWKGYYEAHFMSGKEIYEKYPILNKTWQYSYHTPATGDSECGYYYSYYRDWGAVVTDPWFRELKSNDPIKTTELQTIFSTTVEGNKVILVIYSHKYL
jgi:hypothetical protein